MGVLDLAVTAAAWAAAYFLRFHTVFAYTEGDPPGAAYLYHDLIVSLLGTLLVFSWMGMYRPRRVQTVASECWDLLKACAIVWAMDMIISHYLHQPRISILLQGLFAVCWPLMMIAYRGSARLALRYIRGRGHNLRTVAIIGSGRLGQKLLHALRQARWMGYRIMYFIEDRRIGESFLGVPVLGPLDEVDQILRRQPVDAVFVTLGNSGAHRLNEILARLSAEMVDVYLVPDLQGSHFLRQRFQQVGPLAIIGLTDSPQGGFRGVLKRLADVIVSAAMLVVLSPLLAAIALAVKLSSRGPVLYRQQRASLGGRPFEILKFRSMRDGEAAPSQGDAAAKQAGEDWSTGPNDPRVTPLGRVLRKLSLDELPQLLNVLKGDMSLVGPRPERPEFIERFSKTMPRYMLRHHVKAGLTGWAQVNGFRGRTSLRKRIQYDLDYINRWSLGFDAWIVLRTISRGFINRSE